MNAPKPLSEVTPQNQQNPNQKPEPAQVQDPIPKNQNRDNPNPYLRRYGSHVKSHFSQSRCEFFESSDEENKQNQEPVNTNNVNSLDHINDIRPEQSRNISENNIPRTSNLKPKAQGLQDMEKETNTLGKSPSIDSGHSGKQSPQKQPEELPPTDVPNLNLNGQEMGLQRKDSLEMELDEFDEQESDRKSALIIKSRRGSVSSDSFDRDAEGQIKPEKGFVNKFFENGKVVEEPKPKEG
jgi:hypothetical protein